jgi:putative tricarboxylic transport membrane protein
MSDGNPPAIGGSRAGTVERGAPNVFGGVILIILGLVALIISFYHPGPVGDYVPPEAFELSPAVSAERGTKDDAVAMVKKAVGAIKVYVDKANADKAVIDKAAADKAAADKAAANNTPLDKAAADKAAADKAAADKIASDKVTADKAAIDKVALDKAYAGITANGGPYTSRDIYVVIYKTDGVVLANAQNERPVGTNLKDSTDPDERAFIAKHLELAKKNQPFWHYYNFIAPRTQSTVWRQMYCEPLNEAIVCGDVGALAPGVRSHFLSIFLYVMGNFGPVMWPRVFSLLFILCGLGMTSGHIQVRNRQDFFGGLALIGLAVVAMLASIDLPGMRGFAFGPGTAPRLFANLLAVLGLVVSVTGLLNDGPEGQRYTIPGIIVVGGALVGWLVISYVLSFITPNYAQVIATALLVAASLYWLDILDQVGVRGPFLITVSIFTFAVFIRPLGLVLASFIAIMVCAGAATDIRWRESAFWGMVLTTFCSILFPYGLNLPFQLWPPWWTQEFFIKPLWVAIAVAILMTADFARSHMQSDGRGSTNV